MLPESLKLAIEEEARRYPQDRLMEASFNLSKRYRMRSDLSKPFMIEDIDRAAYIAARLPATFTVLKRVFSEIEARMPNLNPRTLLDLGSGPGTALWAAAEIFHSLEKALLIEQDSKTIELGKKIALKSPDNIVGQAEWRTGKLQDLPDIESTDLVVISYALGEVSPADLDKVIENAWKLAEKVLVIIEPGTLAGFETILEARNKLIQLEGHIIAPCPHAESCPLPKGDWCHFAERLERTSLHRAIKEGRLSYEDEKYSYAVFSKEKVMLPFKRVLRHPQKHSGHVQVTTCSKDGINKEIISKRHGELYKSARKAEWGDAWEER